jgi:hypothetical protein
MSKQPNFPIITNASQKPSRAELRASLLLPVFITIIIWLFGLIITRFAPGKVQFNQVLGVLISGALITYLLLSTRHAATRLRIIAFLIGIPALAGVTVGLIDGRSSFIVIGVGITFLLLVLQRTLTVPFSYRAALHVFQAGNIDQAQQLINKSIASQPDFAESYQLRARIHLMNQRIGEAEKDIRQALARQPKMDFHYNLLGQIYMAAGRYADAIPVYEHAIVLNNRQAMHDYHLGLCYFRIDAFAEAAEAFAAATRKTIPTTAYDLLTHYYLWCSLKAIDRQRLAAEVFAKLPNFVNGLPSLVAQIEEEPTYHHIKLLQQDIEAIQKLAQACQLPENSRTT